MATVRQALPRGQTLPKEAWARRHKAMMWLLWAHVLVLPAFHLLRGFGLAASVASVAPIALAGVAGGLKAAGRRARSVAVVFGLLTASAVLVNAWDGQIEAHFHFFVMIAVLALYEDWLPFGLAVSYVVAEHGVLGAISPTAVYNHGGNPWAWAAIHGFFVLGAVSASVVTWRLNEDMRARLSEAHRDARDTAERFQHAFQGGVSGMALVAPEGRFLSVNRALCEITGYSEQELLATDFQAITHPDDLVANVDQLRALLEGAVDTYETEKRYLHRDGHEVWVQVGVSAVRADDGAVRYFISQMHDVTVRRRFQDELAHRALHDPLTGLPNRALFHDRLRHALVRLRRHSGGVTVLFIDLDRFKLVNDGMGHRVGDAVLVDAAQRLCDAARAEDTVARFGGDEFTILCENAGEEAARLVAERVLAAFARPFEHEGHEFHLSASIGIRSTDLATEDPDVVMRDADIALYAAKERGRAGFQVFDSEARMGGIDLLATEHALRLALRRGELCLHYQPEVDLETGRIIALEALVRWQHPERGLVPPAEFIPAAEGSGLIVALGEWVLGEACSQMAVWRRAGVVEGDVRVAVNVSARQLSHPELPQSVAAALAAAELDPAALCLEITESAVIQDSNVVLTNLRAIKQQGVCIALDDFGVGFSSLSQIRELPPVDIIKVDRSFIAGLGRNESDAAVVTAVLGLARSLGVSAVAEGIETEDQLGRLRGLGCDVGQGFFFARPQPPGEIARVLADAAAPRPAGPVDDAPARA
ncbi:MAG TPA: EAL domain-containing protein [Solirubrobacteraceae bacterium]|nr:EAL domain-containing protein [Solirubrobacteraceae bacterium]